MSAKTPWPSGDDIFLQGAEFEPLSDKKAVPVALQMGGVVKDWLWYRRFGII